MGTGFCTKLGKTWAKAEKGLNDAVSRSFVGKYFKLQARKTCFIKELRAATATFLTMAYILTVNATIVADSGATCSLSDCTPPGAPDCVVKPNSGYETCLARIRNDLVVVTALSAMIGSFSMGVLANLPLAVAPAMGPNAYFTYNLVGFHGTGSMTYGTGLAVLCVEGLAFLILSASGLRAKVARLIPQSVRLACAAGIGLFIAFVGLQAHQGVGLVGPDPSTLVTVTACAHTDPVTGACVDGKMRSPTFWLGMVGLVITCYGLMKEVKGSMIYGILFVTLISWIRGTAVTYFPYTQVGDTNFNYFKKVVDFHRIESTAGAISFTNFNRSEVWVALMTLLYVDVLATTGVLYTMAELGGFVDDKGSFEGEYLAYLVDAGTTVVASTLGGSPVATYVESSAGLREGGRTGLTAVIVSVYFMLSLFFTPLLTSVPPWAIGPSLVMVGVLMMKVVKDIEWGNVKEAVPAFATMVLMPLTYSIANGIIGGVGIYIVLSLYDYAVWVVRRAAKMRREKNQVSAAAGGDQDVEMT
ncbi:hypothetical protein PVL29_022792 [Vitis rotundifolia]|uniref:Adenine/guanine permease AZG2 n=1 Tax=Vitis rotundifolia TaxID=103349 RepID=A0AA38YWJ5_VITRO|nr:hypothetical protein PVL29_022792 [Vitis rotundifolia]